MKLTTFENPRSGKSGDLFDIAYLWKLVLGGAVLAITSGFGSVLAVYMRQGITRLRGQVLGSRNSGQQAATVGGLPGGRRFVG